MNYIKKYQILYLVIFIFSLTNCKEEIDFESITTYEKLVVIEATITNELKFQVINISTTFKFDEDKPIGVTNADVKIIDDLQNSYIFE